MRKTLNLIEFDLWRFHRRYLSNYAIRTRLFWLEAHLIDLSFRPFGDRFLSVAKNDRCCVYLNDESERFVITARVPIKPNVWGPGWVHMHKMDGKRIVCNDDEQPIAYHEYGQVMWRPLEGT